MIASARSTRTLAWPYLVGLCALVAVPAVTALGLAFTQFTGVQPPRFNGTDNFSRLLGDPGFWRALGNSLIYVAISLPLRLTAAVGLALLLHRRSRGVSGARAVGYLPTVIPDVAYALLWLWILNPIYGPLTAGFEALGLTSPSWLTDPWAARVSIAVMGAFQMGEAFVIALATRRAISTSLYEAAAVDGASPWFALTRITLPLMGPVLALLALRDFIYSFQVNFVPALIVTEGGPRYATTYLPLFVYKSAFSYFRLGYASTIALVMFLLTLVVVIVQYMLAKRWRLA